MVNPEPGVQVHFFGILCQDMSNFNTRQEIRGEKTPFRKAAVTVLLACLCAVEPGEY